MIFSISPLLKILAIFALILILGRCRWPMGPILLLAALLLGIWFQMDLAGILSSGLHSAVEFQTVSLCFIILLILILSRAMKEGGQLERIVAAFSSLLGKGGLSIAFLPALIGLLPMPGGAMFSAPMVEVVSRGRGMAPEVKAAANHWFRHIWEYSWPLYPGIILVVALSNIQLGQFILRQFPVTVIAFSLGFLILRAERGRSRIDLSHTVRSLREVFPILLVVALSLLLRYLLDIGQNLALLISLVISIGWVVFRNKISFSGLGKIVLHKANLSMFILGVGIMVFKGILNDSGALEGIRDDLYSHNIPSLLMIMFLPFLSGLVTGITVGFVGPSLPLVISLFPGEPQDCLQYLVLAYGCGFLGVLLSPVHICLVLTRDYFKVSLVKIYAKLLLPCLLLFAGLLLLFLLYS